jgi:hypothetical protein
MLSSLRIGTVLVFDDFIGTIIYYTNTPAYSENSFLTGN